LRRQVEVKRYSIRKLHCIRGSHKSSVICCNWNPRRPPTN